MCLGGLSSSARVAFADTSTSPAFCLSTSRKAPLRSPVATVCRFPDHASPYSAATQRLPESLDAVLLQPGGRRCSFYRRHNKKPKAAYQRYDRLGGGAATPHLRSDSKYSSP